MDLPRKGLQSGPHERSRMRALINMPSTYQKLVDESHAGVLQEVLDITRDTDARGNLCMPVQHLHHLAKLRILDNAEWAMTAGTPDCQEVPKLRLGIG